MYHKEQYTLDFRGVKNFLEMHFIIRDTLGFSAQYGCSFDALWECLTAMVGQRIRIEILGLEVIEARGEGSAKAFIDILSKFKHYKDDAYADDVQIEIVRGDTRESIK